MEQHPLITLLAAGTLGDWIARLFGPNTPASAILLFLLVSFALLILVLIALGAIFNTFSETWRLFRWLKVTRDKTFPCMHCGYDLRHRPDRCPECGQPVWFKSRGEPPQRIPPPPTEEDLAPIELEPELYPDPIESPVDPLESLRNAPAPPPTPTHPSPDTANNDPAQPVDR